MIAIDTNVVVRFLAGDHPVQFAAATQLVNTGVFVSKTVILEAAWVLRSNYGYSEPEAYTALSEFAALPTVELESASQIAEAFDLFKAGLDFADALHLASADSYESFATFDRQLAKAAKRAGYAKVQQL